MFAQPSTQSRAVLSGVGPAAWALRRARPGPWQKVPATVRELLAGKTPPVHLDTGERGLHGMAAPQRRQSVQAPPASAEALAAVMKARPRAPSSTVGKSRARGSAGVPVRRAATASATSE